MLIIGILKKYEKENRNLFNPNMSLLSHGKRIFNKQGYYVH